MTFHTFSNLTGAYDDRSVSKRFWLLVVLLATISALVHFYAASWFDISRQHDPSKHFSVLIGVVNFEAFPSYNGPYYYILVAFVSAPFAALYRMHLISELTFVTLSVAWSGFVFQVVYIIGNFMFARVLRFSVSEQFFFVAFCILLPPVQRSFSMLRPENFILTLTPFACVLLITWWRAIQNGVPTLRYPAQYLTLGILSLIAVQKVSGLLLAGALWFFLFLCSRGSLYFRVQQLLHPTLILVAMILSLLTIDKLASGVSIFEHPANEQEDYLHTPSLSVFTSVSIVNAWEEPLRNNQAGSMVNILLIDMFADYWQYGILQSHGQSAEWDMFRARTGITVSIVFFGIYFLSLAVLFTSIVRTPQGSNILREKALLSTLFFLGIAVLIIAGRTYYMPTKFDTIKWEYIIMFVPFMMIPPVHMLSKCNNTLKRLIVIPALCAVLSFAILQSVWISPDFAFTR